MKQFTASDDVADDVTYPLFQQTAAKLANRIEFLLDVLRDRSLAASREKTP